MRNSHFFVFLAILTAVIAAAAVSCEKVDVKGKKPDFPSPGEVPDTALYVAAVRVPAEYDWRRDTAAGVAGCHLILYRNMEQIADYPTGSEACISTDPDTHHLIEGDIYTEFATQSETIIKKNGETVLRYPGREILAGLLPSGRSIYTLGRLRNGRGYVFRKNGELLLNLEECSVFGGFNASSYGKTGALYMDGGHIYFFYKDAGGNCFKVKDGYPLKIDIKSSYEVYDMKLHDGRDYIFYRTALGTTHLKTPDKTVGLGSYKWLNAGIAFDQGNIYIVGARVTSPFGLNIEDIDSEAVCQKVNGELVVFESGADFFYCREDESYGLCYSKGCLSVDDGAGPFLEIPDTFCFSRDCATITDAGFCVGVTPRRSGGRPYVMIDGEDYPLELDGFISAVEFTIKY